jgi:hypothetical protein
MFRRLEAEACAKAGDLKAGLQAIEEALAVSKETKGVFRPKDASRARSSAVNRSRARPSRFLAFLHPGCPAN